MVVIGRGYTCWHWLKRKRNEVPREWNRGILTQSEEDKPDSQVKNLGLFFPAQGHKKWVPFFPFPFFILYSLTVSDSSLHAFIRRLFSDK